MNSGRCTSAAMFVGRANLIACLFASTAWSQSRLEFVPTTLVAGQEGRITLRTTTDFHLQGFSLSVEYDAEILDIEAKDVSGTILETIEPDFVRFSADPVSASLVIGVLVVAGPPFEDRQIPGIGISLDLLDIVVNVREDTQAETTSLHFVDGHGEPAIFNRFVVENESVVPDQLGDAEFAILGSDVVIGTRPFVRGDVNQDRTIDIADPITLLRFLYVGIGNPFCHDGADSNDDEKLDISDCVYLLGFLFIGKEPPRPPYPDKGLDRSGDGALDCAWSNYGRF